MTINLNDYKFYFISSENGSREDCSVFYADYVLAKSKKEAIAKVFDDAEYDDALGKIKYNGPNPDMEDYYDDFFIEPATLEVA